MNQCKFQDEKCCNNSLRSSTESQIEIEYNTAKRRDFVILRSGHLFMMSDIAVTESIYHYCNYLASYL